MNFFFNVNLFQARKACKKIHFPKQVRWNFIVDAYIHMDTDIFSDPYEIVTSTTSSV